MTSFCRLTSCTLRDVVPHRSLSASFSRSATASAAALSSRSLGSPNGLQISDIFDAPARLAEKPTSVERLSTFAFYMPSVTQLTWKADPPQSGRVAKDTWDLPWSLPPPITFDGPARPSHMSASTLASRRLRRPHASGALHIAPAVSCGASVSTSEPIYQLFDGPSRAPRYRYSTFQEEGHSFTYISLGLGLSSAFGLFVLKDDLELKIPIPLASR